ncbi:class I SAM-dependent methyltransferase [Mucilaginibacter sp. NFX135]|uniref:class I SAM-dependent methyltransferase n=1 Tax=Mucilaginibacter sp. NFX135 TaxID=3402687 RepID=UPI003AFB5917
MYSDTLNISYFRKDAAFDTLYPQHIRELSEMHWTTLDVSLEASNFLATPGARILDIGSGVGKFCISAGVYHPEATFYGVEQREELFHHAQIAKEQIGVSNVQFIYGNLMDLDYDLYDHFYFYNPFYENIEPRSRIDHTVWTSSELYRRYTLFIYGMLNKRPAGTKLVTFHAPDNQVPASYQLMDNSYNSVLKMWVKE